MREGTLIRLEGVSKTYRMGQTDVHALREVDLSVPSGQFVVVLGPSGSGKTTLLNIIGGIDTPTEGRVMVGGESIQTYNERELTEYRRRHIGFVFQFFNLFPTLTAIENVEFAADLVKMKRAKAMEFLTTVGLRERLDHFPSQLSGGEQQRVSIARALAKNPSILLADEPTGELDADTGVRVLAVLRRINRESGKTTLLVTHNHVIAKIADRVIRLRSGRIVEDRLVDSQEKPGDLTW